MIAYDGSEHAKQAIRVVGRVLGSRPAVVVHVWNPGFDEALVTRAFAGGPSERDRELFARFQQALREEGANTTDEGVAAAQGAGLQAVGEAVPSNGSEWRTIAATARRHGSSLLVVGSRGLGAARSVLLGSVSSGLVQNAELPILVVPDQPTEAQTG